MGMFGTEFEMFKDALYRFGLEYFRRYHGPYRCVVEDNKDPAGLGRIIVSCPRARLLAENGNWVFPMMHGAGKECGIFWPPVEKDHVFVFFENGDPTNPLGYVGGWYANDEVHKELDPEDDGVPKKRGFRTPGGHLISMQDTDGKEKILIRHKDGAVVEWTSDGKVSIGKEGGPFEPMMKGTTVKAWLESHTHPHSWGPTGPPIAPFPPKGLSEDVEGT
jgi:uncharacterized protein involved in type VI secretion and phage assembly